MTEAQLAALPETEFAKRALKRISPIYDNSYFTKKFFDALGASFDPIRGYFEGLRFERFIQTVSQFGIEFLEHKYSVPVDKNLDLETRRARLGIKAFRHTPLNPAVLEKFALDNFNLRTYLDESEPGIIGVVTNAAGVSLNKFIKFLLIERPAHLCLKLKLFLFAYLDDGETYELPDKILKTPPLPRNDLEKKNFPRLFAGGFLLRRGEKKLPLPPPPDCDLEAKIFAGNLLLKSARAKILLDAPQDCELAAKVFAETLLIKSARKKIYPSAAAQTVTANLSAGTLLLRSGRRKILPDVSAQTLTNNFSAGTLLIKSGRIKIGG